MTARHTNLWMNERPYVSPTAPPAGTAYTPNRREHSRHAPQTCAAVWFNTGSDIGETCALRDVSLSGFSIRCDEWQLPLFLGTEGRPIYCVVLMGEAHFGCMARLASSPLEHSGHLGFVFDVMPYHSVTLLEGLIAFMAQRDGEQLRDAEDAAA